MSWINHDHKSDDNENDNDLLNKQLLANMKELEIPQALQLKILNLPQPKKESMLELYIQQTSLIKNPHKSPSNDPILDKVLLDRMTDLYVPKHIQSQIMSLPTEKKRILLKKYESQHQHSSPSQFHLDEKDDTIDDDKFLQLQQNFANRNHHQKQTNSNHININGQPRIQRIRHRESGVPLLRGNGHRESGVPLLRGNGNINNNNNRHSHRSSTRITHTRNISRYTNNTNMSNISNTSYPNRISNTTKYIAIKHRKSLTDSHPYSHNRYSNQTRIHRYSNNNNNNQNGHDLSPEIKLTMPPNPRYGHHKYSNSQNNISSIFDATFLDNIHHEMEDSHCTNINMNMGLEPQATQTSLMVQPSNHQMILPFTDQDHDTENNNENPHKLPHVVLPKSPDFFHVNNDNESNQNEMDHKRRFIQMLSKRRLPMSLRNSQDDILTNINSSHSLYDADIDGSGSNSNVDDLPPIGMDHDSASDDEHKQEEKESVLFSNPNSNHNGLNSNLDSELFDIMDQLDLTTEADRSIKYHRSLHTLHKEQQRKKSAAMMIHPGSSISDDVSEETSEDDIYVCLRCLRHVNIGKYLQDIDSNNNNHNTSSIYKCKFHAFSSQGPAFNDVEYFMQRNEELANAKDFNFACCDRKCRGAFNNSMSQNNGCHIAKKHLFMLENRNFSQKEHIHHHSEVPKYDHDPTDSMDDNESESKHEHEFTVRTNTDEQIEGGSTHPQDLSGIDYGGINLNVNPNLSEKKMSESEMKLNNDHDNIGIIKLKSMNMDNRNSNSISISKNNGKVHGFSNPYLCGKWKVFIYKQQMEKSDDILSMVRDVNIVKHTKHGIIEGILIGTTYITQDMECFDHENKYQVNERIYNGQLKDNQLILTYRGKKSYTASYLLSVEEFELNGQWIDSMHQKGNCQWFKIQKIL